MKGLYTPSNYAQCVLCNSQYGGDHRMLTLYHCNIYSQGLWNIYVDIKYKNIQTRFIMVLHAWGYLSYPTLHYKVWSTIVSKYKHIQIGQPHDPMTRSADSGQIINFFISSLLIVFVQQYNYRPSALTNY